MDVLDLELGERDGIWNFTGHSLSLMEIANAWEGEWLVRERQEGGGGA